MPTSAKKHGALQTSKGSSVALYDQYINTKLHKLKMQTPSRLICHTKAGFSYYSSNIKQNSNGQFKDHNNEKIVCRHLSYYQVRHDKAYHASLISADKVEELKYNLYDRVQGSNCAKFVCIIDYRKMGDLLVKVAKKMLLTDQAVCRFLICSDFHVMGLVLKRKLTDGVGKWIVKFYDPDDTLRHIRSIYPTADSLSDYSLEAIWPEIKSTCITDNHISLTGLTAVKELKNGLSMIPKSYSPVVLATAMSNNLAKLVSKCIHGQLNSSEPEAVKVAQLLSFTQQGRSSALAAGLCHASKQAVSTYVRAVLESNLSEQAKKALLSGGIELYKPTCLGPFNQYSLSGHRTHITPFMTAVLTEQKTHLSTRHGMISEFVSTILNSNLTTDTQKYLINTGFYKEVTIHKRDHKGALLYPLVPIRIERNCSPLAALFRNKATRLIKDLVNQILTSSCLSNADKVTLLVAQDGAAEAGLHISMTINDVPTVVAFTSAILESTLPEDDKVKILAHPVEERLETPLQVGLAESDRADVPNRCVKEFARQVLSSNLSEQAKQVILAADNFEWLDIEQKRTLGLVLLR